MARQVLLHLPRDAGNGYHKPKFHMLFHLPEMITEYGSLMNFTTEFCESHHKYNAKIPGKRSAKRRDTMVYSIAKRVIEDYAIDLYLKLVSYAIPEMRERNAIGNNNETNTTQLQPMDVICGRGKIPNNHPGNKRLRQIVNDSMPSHLLLDVDLGSLCGRCLRTNDSTIAL